MGDAARELADGIHLLRVTQLLFGLTQRPFRFDATLCLASGRGDGFHARLIGAP